MKIFADFPEIDKKTIITIGTFDGVHKGHSDLLNTVKEVAKSKKLESVLITFEPHPRTVVSSDYKIRILTTLDEKAKELEKYGIDNLLVINFTEKFSNMNADEFIENLLIKKLNPSQIIIGHDHKFGKDRKGDGAYLKKLSEKHSFSVTVVPAVEIEGKTVSSTHIRNSLLEGDLAAANFYLGRPYSITGRVVEGAQRGRVLGYPTANIKPVDNNKLIPKDGVYIVNCKLDDNDFPGALNIGKRPTFEDGVEPIIEAYLFGLDTDIYNKVLKVEFLERIRDEMKFSDQESLIEQINTDVQLAKKYFNK